MVIFPEIPTRILRTGDIDKAAKLVPFGKKRFADLMTDVSFMDLPTGENKITLNDGSIIKTSICHGISNIYIHVPVEEAKRRGEHLECFCSPCAAMGVIRKIRNYSCDEETGKRSDLTSTDRPVYDVDVCNGNDAYLSLENFNIMSSGWEIYYKDELVLVSVSAIFKKTPQPDCCVDGACLFSVLNNAKKLDVENGLVILPYVFQENGFSKWERVVDDSDISVDG